MKCICFREHLRDNDKADWAIFRKKQAIFNLL